MSPPPLGSSRPRRVEPESPRGRSRLVKLTTAIAAAVAVSAIVTPPIAPTAAATDEVRTITLPIHPDHIDEVTWTDTYGAARGAGRRHIGVDIMGEKMIPLVAARSGTITWGRFDNAGGSIIRFRDEDGWEYQYIHLNNDSPGTDDGRAACTEVLSARLCGAVDGDGDLRRGTAVTEGEVIAYMGDGGNAEGTRAHLHFEIYRPSGDGTEAINPTASVDAARDRIGTSPTPSGPPPVVAPGADGFTDHLWYRLHGRRPTSAERAAFDTAVDADGVWGALATTIAADNAATAVDRLYLAFFQRYPDTEGITYWSQKAGDGHRLEDIAEWFAESDEFRERYANVDFGTFLDRLYIDVLGRRPDDGGKEYWLRELAARRVDRGTIVVQFTQSPELRRLAARRSEVVALSLLADGTAPSAAAVDTWADDRTTTGLHRAIQDWFAD